MHEFHAWIGLAQSPYEDDDDLLERGVAEVRAFVGRADWPDAVFAVRRLNGQYFLTATGFVNRIRDEGRFLDDLLGLIARVLPGSYGLVHDRADEMPMPPGPGMFRVRVLARGLLTERADPFLSPCNPVIED
ncbi:Imm7 family immunity protein [Actinoplanes sp. NPDC049316]|uniref:Imm7 family immunity protein n=1 Tax=Actinoplanes sp. NPDC049316 TaxID=3154727 RepID=UPI003421F648